MTSLESEFNQQNIDPEKYYSGYEGYERGLAEMWQSFQDAFPQYNGRVALVDLKALDEDRDAELARLSKELGVEDIEVVVGDKIGSGRMFSGVNESGEKIVVAAGWSIHNYPPEFLSFKENLTGVSVVIHELAHAVDELEGTIDVEGTLPSNYTEGYADAFRIALSVLHGRDNADSEKLVATYDNRQISIGPEGYKGGWFDRYDNGPMLKDAYFSSLRARDELKIEGTAQNFDFQYWDKAKEIADTAREDHLGRHSAEEAAYQQLRYRFFARNAVMNQEHGLRNSIGHQKAMHISEHDDPMLFEHYTELVRHLMYRMDVQAYESGELCDVDHLYLQNLTGLAQDRLSGFSQEDLILAMDIAYEARNKLNEWMEERKDYIIDADRMLAGYKYLAGKGEFADYQTPDFDPLLFLGKSMQMYMRHGDFEDEDIAKGAIRVLKQIPDYEHGTIFEHKSTEDLIEFFKSNPDAVNALAKGESLEDALVEAGYLDWDYDAGIGEWFIVPGPNQ